MLIWKDMSLEARLFWPGILIVAWCLILLGTGLVPWLIGKMRSKK